MSDTPSGWVEVNGALEREFVFGNFAEAVEFVNRVSAVAAEEDHHPDVEIRWNRVRLRFWTHVAGGITERDHTLAARVNDL